jgi:ribonuclease BN (tRNA processing enzyme)
MRLGAQQKRGLLAATRSVLRGNKVCNQSISNHHQSLPKKVVDINKSNVFSTSCLKGRTVKACHSDPDTVGFIFDIGDNCRIGYIADTEYFHELGKLYRGAKLLLVSVLRPSGKPWKGHMTTDDVVNVVREANPEMAVITHFGMLMIAKGPSREAKLIARETGIPTKAAHDNMHIHVGEEIVTKDHASLYN